MSNETRTGAPLGATVGERLVEKAHEGDAEAAGALDAAGAAARSSGETSRREEPAAARGAEVGRGSSRGAQRRPQRGSERSAGTRRGAEAQHPEPQRPDASGGGGNARLWALAAGLGTWLVAGMIGRAFRR